MTFTFDINGFKVEAEYSECSVTDIFLPLIEHWRALYRQKGRRITVFLCAPPAVGKTTLSKLLERLSEQDGLEPLQAVGLDGFHYSAEYLASHTVKGIPMRSIKGAPETFDIARFKTKLCELRHGNTLFPVYDRNLHDVISDALEVDRNIVLIEGNWLLLNEDGWKTLVADDTVFIHANGELLKKRLIARKIRGGMRDADALQFYNNSDKRNIERVLNNHIPARLTLIMDESGEYSRL